MALAATVFPPQIRPLDVRRDLLQVADLIEVAFSNNMDPEGHDYVRYIRRVSHNNSLIRWVPGAAERVSVPLHGYVWEENDKIIGNLTLIPFLVQGHWYYLLANIAVHPDYRRQGIGRWLTQRGLQHTLEHHVHEAWLQVRDDNPAAHQLYLSLGFQEQVRRTTWQGSSAPVPGEPPGEPAITPRRRADWEQQARWLADIYPPQVSWNLSFDWRRLRPGLLRALAAWINGEIFVHWAARKGNELVGTATWEPGRGTSDIIWLCAQPDREDDTIASLLTHIRGARLSNRYLTVNYPAGRALAGFTRAGFTPLHTLIWMRVIPQQGW